MEYMDEKDETLYRNCNVSDLPVEDLKWIYDTKEYEHPQCLNIYKWSR